MTQNSAPRDIKLIIEAIKDYLPKCQLSNAYYYSSLPLALIDAVFSISVRYRQVEHVIQHFTALKKWDIFRVYGSEFPEPDREHTITEFIQSFDNVSSPGVTLFNNLGYSNPRASEKVSKATTVLEAAIILKKFGVDSFNDREKLQCEELEQAFNALPALSSGIVFRYFKMLSGDDQEVKPDRWIIRFLSSITHKKIESDQAVTLIQETALEANRMGYSVTPRQIDHLIWNLKQATATRRTGSHHKINMQRKNFDLPIHAHPDWIQFWDACKKGGVIRPSSLEFGVEEDFYLWIKSANSKQQAEGKKYRITRPTVRKYMDKISEPNFRQNHGWFSRVYDTITSQLNQESAR